MDNQSSRFTQAKYALYAAFPCTIPVLAGFLVLGIAYGVLMQARGFGLIWVFLMSAVAFCGSMQFVAIELLASVFNPLQAFLMSIMVNARHLFYGISMLEKYKGLGKIRAFLVYVLCDETFSIVSSVDVPAEIKPAYFYGAISLLNYLYWIVSTVIGSLLGSLISFNTEGLDFVLTALFVVLFLEQWKTAENRKAALLGLGSTVLSLFVFGSQLVIPAMIIILAGLMAGRGKLWN